MASTSGPDDGLERAWGWVDHLRAGGVTPWARYDGRSPSRGSSLPGAIQLETARRLNLAGGDDTPAHRAMVDRVLDSSGPGRGQPDLELEGVHSGSRFGPRPIDPGFLPVDELLRMAVGLIAELVVELDPGDVDFPRPSGGRPWRRAWTAYGDPLAAAHLRDALRRAGHAPGRRSPVVLVLADDLAAMLADTWSWRVQQGVNPAWRRWLAGWARRDELPRVLDLPRVAARQASGIGAERVHLVVGGAATPAVADLLGVRRPLAAPGQGLSAAATDLVREVNVVLRVLVRPDRHQHLLRRVLLPLMTDEVGPRRAVPRPHRDWVRRRAERMRDELHRAGYPVHGDLGALVPVDHEREVGPTDDGVLEVALRTLLKVKENAL